MMTMQKIIRSVLDAEHAAELRRDKARADGDKETAAELQEVIDHLTRARVAAIAVKMRLGQ